MEAELGIEISRNLVAMQEVGTSQFENIFHSFRGNAFGHANTLTQSLIFKPSMESVKVTNLVYAGHLTNPGPGVPPTLISGIVAGQLLDEKLKAAADDKLETTFSSALFYLMMGIVCLHVLFVVLVLIPSARARSYLLCVKLMFEHGRTYFAAASLMKPIAFLDTAAMYGLFRIADDFVDCPDAPEVRSAALEKFITDFYRCLDAGKGDYSVHPALPAIIESALRRKYPRRVFELFFRSMRQDAVKKLVIKNYDELEYYMDGSAAVIGEFMLPILNPEAPAEETAQALPHARDLGFAFQLTNMIRDINEDLDIGRIYMPTDVLQKHGVDVTLRTANQPGFKPFMDEMFSYADKMYVSADKGIDFLPKNVRNVIRVARLAYHEIHNKIKVKQDYDVFKGRAKVPFTEKLSILVSNVPTGDLIWISMVEVYVRTMYMLTRRVVLALLLSLIYLYYVVGNDHAVYGQTTYLEYHFIFTLPMLFCLCVNAISSYQWEHVYMAMKTTLMMCVIATLYTTPWDNYLVYRHVWGYENAGRVIGVLWYVPYEEYAYFSIQTLLCGAMWLTCFPKATSVDLPKAYASTATKSLWTFFLVAFTALFILAVNFLIWGGQYTYFGLILVWAVPVMMLQWFVGGQVILHFWNETSMCIFALSTFLAATDQWAISNGIWEIQQKYSLPQLIHNLPFEELSFFFIASIMAVWGITLAMVCFRYNHINKEAGGLLNSILCVYEWGHPSPSSSSSPTDVSNDIYYFIGLTSVICYKLIEYQSLGDTAVTGLGSFFVIYALFGNPLDRSSGLQSESKMFFILSHLTFVITAFSQPGQLINNFILPIMSAAGLKFESGAEAEFVYSIIIALRYSFGSTLFVWLYLSVSV